ncbi:MAG: hypothetical protein JSW38_10885 [Dehalococcoidia bacterium]|nr:MAG: hypothetical protein JSW38_10885 [Dehalococcoidia bacterium]
MNRNGAYIKINPFMIGLIRSIHALIALVMFAAIGVVYYSAVSQEYDLLLYLALVALFIEGVAITLNKGDCPLSYLQRKYGDDKTFFELFLPKRIAKQMFRFNFLLISIACMILLFNYLI